MMGKAWRSRVERREVVRKRPGIIEALWEQYEFIRSSAILFDEGRESEAKRIATALRVLTHDTRSSKSVLGQLDLLDRILMLNTAESVNPRNLLTTSGLVSLRVGDGAFSYVPYLNDYPPRSDPVLLPYRTWLTAPVAKAGGRHWSREHLIVSVVNKDGGAHVDPTLPEEFHELSRRNSMGWFSSDSASRDQRPPQNRYDLAAIRQIGHEMIMSVNRFHDEGTISRGVEGDGSSAD